MHRRQPSIVNLQTSRERYDRRTVRVAAADAAHPPFLGTRPPSSPGDPPTLLSWRPAHLPLLETRPPSSPGDPPTFLYLRPAIPSTRNAVAV
eukprot:6173214-Pleurochrysis_carterae.AAC.6